MAALKSEHKEFIVKQLACFKNPQEVANEVKTTFGVEVSLQQLNHYNPKTANGAKLAEKWKELYRYTQDEFMDEAIKHPIAHKGYRIGILQKELDELLSKANPNYVLINQILEQAAKEMGGVFEGKVPNAGGTGDNGVTLIQQVNQRIENKINITNNNG